MAKTQVADIRRWALVGAEQRLLQIAEEAKAIYLSFPELRGGRRNLRALVGNTESAQPQRRRRRMSREARKRISEAQKARWAKQRAEQAGAAAVNTQRGKASRKKK